MQAVMWAILGATIGLAAFVDRQRARVSRIELKAGESYGNLDISLPKKWTVTVGEGEAGGHVVVQAVEPGPRQSARTIAIERERVNEFISPLEYLMRSVLWRSGEIRIDNAEDGPKVTSCKIDGWPGVLVAGERITRVRGELVSREEILACTVLPSRQVILISLQGPGPLNEPDRRLVQEVGEKMIIGGERLQDQHGGELELAGGTHLAVPGAFTIIPQADLNRTSRQLLYTADAHHWVSAELIPCLLLDARPQSVLGMLTLHDPRWQKGTPRTEGERRWRIDPPGVPGDAGWFPARAHLLAAENGQALLVIFHGSDAEDAEVYDAAWEEISAKAQFSEESELEALQKAGTDEVEKFTEQGLGKLLPEGRDDEWWLWYSETASHVIGWSNTVYRESSNKFTGKRITKWRGEYRKGLQSVQMFASDDDWRTYAMSLTISEMGEREINWVPSISQKFVIADRKIDGKDGPPMPKDFLPGGWLPLILSRVSSAPMLVQTESFIGYEQRLNAELLRLRIEPTEEEPRTIAGENAPMRCLKVQVNGSGEISRWYFKGDGELEQIDFPDGVRRVRDTEAGVGEHFAGDTQMLP